jgi:Mlc titration factor MtfA (ptsG expression regulator)
MAPIFILLLIIAFILLMVLYKRPVKKAALPTGYKELLLQHVVFYQKLDDAGKIRFEEKLKEFLGYIKIHGVKTEVTDLDKLLIASSGVIPIFGFPEWKYYNLRDILLYPAAFNEVDFSNKVDADILGMVGSGAMQRMMILSKPALHQGFAIGSDKANTGVHEFVHLIDKEDGDVDGVPELLLEKQYAAPWLNLIAKEIDKIKHSHSDIDVYGAKNKAEFFAVASEYFFEQPEKFKEKHAELYQLMTQVFNQGKVK